MYLSRIRLHPNASQNKEFWYNIGNSYQIHRLIWSLFADAPSRNRDFLYRIENNGKLPTFYCVSTRKPEDESGLWQVESKLFDPVLHINQRLSFALRVNPIRTKRDVNGKQHRHDVVMEAKTQLKLNGIPKDQWPPYAEIVQKEGFSWLSKRGDQYGFIIHGNEIRADGYLQQKFYKPKGKHYVNISTIEFNGLLTVTDPERFKNALYQGIGPAKGFGYGLMLVRHSPI